MNSRFIIFCLVGVIIGSSAGVITTVVGLEITVNANSDPIARQRLMDTLVTAVLFWAGLGLIGGILFFLPSKVMPPIITAGRPVRQTLWMGIEYSRVRRMLIYMTAVYVLVNTFWLIPFLAKPGITEPRSIIIRLIASIIISLTTLKGTFLVAYFILRRQSGG